MRDHHTDQQNRTRLTRDAIAKRIADSPYGNNGKRWAARWLDVESYGQVGLALFNLPPIVERAHGDILIDVDGKEYVDLLAGFSVSALGQCSEEITAVIREQAGKLVHYFDLPHPERIEMAERLARICPIKGGQARVAFGVTGADAVELAVRAARYWSGRPIVLTAFGDYHGVTYGTMALTGKGGMWPYFYPVLPLDTGVSYFPFPYPYQSPFGRAPEGEDEAAWCLSRLEDYLSYFLESKESPYREVKSGITSVAAFVVEPYQSSAGYILPSPGYMKLLRRLADKYDILLMVDEIQTGLGRTGRLWAVDWEDVEVDVLITSKALGGGLPLSAVVTRSEVLESWGPGAHVSTQAGNALACAAGNRVLDVISDPAFLAGVAERGAYFAAGLEELQRRHPLIGHINSQGIYIGLELVRDRASRQPAPEEASFVLEECVRRGVLFEKGGYFHNRFQLIPPLTIRTSSVDRVLAIFDEAFSAAEKRFGASS